MQQTRFAFRGFRSFYGDLQVLAPLGRISLVAGQNNSGKSNVLKVAQQLGKLQKRAPSDLDVPRGVGPSPFELAIRVGDKESVVDRICESIGRQNGQARAAVLGVLGSTAIELFKDGGVWLNFSAVDGSEPVGLNQQAIALRRSEAQNYLNHYAQERNTHGNMEHTSQDFMRELTKLLELPNVHLVEASRRIDDVVGDISLIQQLAALERPELENDSDRERFAAINEFLRTVIDDSTATLVIPQAAQQINVRRQGLLLPLTSLGTGVAQVVMLAAAATLQRGSLVCMEEPEVHLHPLLQRKLLRYLHDGTDNNYLIATHSAHLLDSQIASVFHATLTQRGTEIAYAGQPNELSKICYDLGYRPSDLLQTNCAIWVEGPSDRIYIAHWISRINPHLREGIDYTIMFYGGRLLFHLSTLDPAVKEFINLKRLNRHLAVVIDSDKKFPQTPINATKRRVLDELDADDGPSFAWVTKGRNIENYVPREILTDVLRRIYREKRFEANSNQWSDALKVTDGSTAPDKVKIARSVVNRWESGLDHLDLHDRVMDLVELIESANGLQRKRAHNAQKAKPAFKPPK